MASRVRDQYRPAFMGAITIRLVDQVAWQWGGFHALRVATRFQLSFPSRLTMRHVRAPANRHTAKALGSPAGFPLQKYGRVQAFRCATLRFVP